MSNNGQLFQTALAHFQTGASRKHPVVMPCVCGPTWWTAHHNLSIALAAQRRLEEALESNRHAWP